MKIFRSMTAAAPVFGSLLMWGWLSGGCASTSNDSPAPKPGQGIAEYREVAGAAHKAVAATVKGLEGLAIPAAQASVSPAALARFDKSFSQLELTSVKARARAEAIIARGQAYFDEWKGNLAGQTNPAVARVETTRYNRLHEHFVRVRERSGEVREEFRPFMAKLREFRARLDRAATTAPAESSRKELEVVTASGRRVLQTLESVSTALNEAEAALRTTLAAKP